MNQSNSKVFLGTGWKFPPTFSKSNCTVQMVSAEADIKESLYILFATRTRERAMQPLYGCNLNVLLFESVTTTFLAYVREMITNAIILYEPRINLIRVSIDSSFLSEGKLNIWVDYVVRATNTRENIVYPFYLLEGTNVDYNSIPANFGRLEP